MRQRCVLAKKFEPVAVGRCERFVADYERENDLVEIPEKAPKNGKRVAIVGAGPSGLTVAGDLTLLGYEVTIFEAFHRPGGVLMYGIPEFRLPKAIVESEVDYLARLGVEIRLNEIVGQTVDIDELLGDEGYDAVFIGVGAGLPMFLGLEGGRSGRNLLGERVSNSQQSDEGVPFSEDGYADCARDERVRDWGRKRRDGLREDGVAPGSRDGADRLPAVACRTSGQGGGNPPCGRGGD